MLVLLSLVALYHEELGIGNVFKRDVSILTRSPEQYNDENNTEGGSGEKNENGSAIVVFDVMLDCNAEAIDPIFTKGCQKYLDVY